jgi:head-tail adaptor
MQRRYDRLVIVQRFTRTQASDGSPIETWADIAYRAPAHVAPTKGSERFSDPQQVAEQEQTVTIRFHAIPSAYRPLTPKDRILYPCDGLAANTQAPATNLILDILSPDEVGRQVDLSIKCKRRSDVTT